MRTFFCFSLKTVSIFKMSAAGLAVAAASMAWADKVKTDAGTTPEPQAELHDEVSLSLAEKSGGGWDKHIFTPDDGELARVNDEDVPAVVKALMSEGDRVIKATKTLGGLHAWIVQIKDNPTQSVSYFTTPDDLFVLSGSILYQDKDNEIQSLSSRLTEKYQPIADLNEMWENLAQSNYIQEGAEKGKRTIYGFIDPNCNFCHLSWLAFKPYVDTAEVQMRWIPVAAINQTSAAKTAHLLQSDNPRASLARSYLTWDSDKEPGYSFSAADEISEETVKKIEENNAQLKAFSATGTPIFLYKDDEGVINMVSGAMRLTHITEVLGANEINNNDPRLDKLR